TTANGQPHGKSWNITRVVCRGEATVQGVTKDKATELRITLTALRWYVNKNNGEDVLPPGTVVVASGQVGGTVFLRQPDGQKLEGLPKDALERCFELKPSEHGGYQETFGTDAKQTVGGTWPMNKAAAVRALDEARPGQPVREEHLSGQC